MRGLIRLILTAVLAGAVVVTAIVVNARTSSNTTSATVAAPLAKINDAKAANATKNDISRTDKGTSRQTKDPTTPRQARSHEQAAAAQRASGRSTAAREQPILLRQVPVDPAQPAVPTNQYNLFNACYGLRSVATGGWLSGTVFSAQGIGEATPLYFKPTDLGRYLLYSPDRTYFGQDLLGRVGYIRQPGVRGDWTVTQAGNGRFRLQLGTKGYLTVGAGNTAALSRTATPETLFTPQRRDGCAAFPEVEVGVRGNPTAGVTPYQETRGYIDAHTHGMAFEFLGGEVHCGRPWSPWGVTTALKDCVDHTLTGGNGALMEAALSGKLTHDPVGWPTFKDWPAPGSLTHEGTYYKWIERSWRAGQRILVNLLVENNQLCRIWPLKRNSCDDMTSLRLQAQDMRTMERYIDAQHGGPGQGWYRIVTNPKDARTVINAGKMAVVMGIETSVLFGCHRTFGLPTCTKADIDRQLDEVQKMGVVQMELVNKFDNALAGVAGDEGTTGYLVNFANTLETGSPWHMDTCDPNDPEIHDKDQGNSLDIPSQDALFGAMLQVLPEVIRNAIPAVPIYSAKHHCNQLGLSDLGSYTITQMAKRKMIFDPDHMSVKARKRSLDVIEQLGYPGVVSSHSWATPDAYPRIYAAGGFITPYAGDSLGFVEKWKRHLTWANPKTYWGFGFGADINGFGAQGDPRPNASKNPVKYPFTGLGGVQVDRQVSGSRVYDINKDGVAHYGLYPDWIEDLRMIAGDRIVDDMARGSEAYLQMWERAVGVKPNACTTPAQQRDPGFFRQHLIRGTDWWTVLAQAGQPDRRAQNSFVYCTKNNKRATVTFDNLGKVAGVKVA